MNDLVHMYYEQFVGLPNKNPIVRNGIMEDAFTLGILDVMYRKILNISIEPSNIQKISRIIVAPPDSGIDLFIEIDDGDEFFYDVIQSKYCELTENEIRKCFAEMERTIKDYLKTPSLVQKNLREVISETNFGESYKTNCTFYVVHTGSLNYGKGFRKYEKIITLSELNILKNSLSISKVPYEEFRSDSFSNYIMYDQSAGGEQALLCNLRGYDLAQLNNKYVNTSMGRNILFGQNLRDSLDSKSKTYEDMKNTIDTEPNRFWHYNNGITIIAEMLDAHKDDENNVDLIELTNFSIINGAQTTSALGTYLKQANINGSDISIEKLKQVYVLARIMEVTDPVLRDNISIYNNSQNPITSRDMVANRIEQRKLNETLMNGEKPHVYVEIRRGAQIPVYPRLYKHQITTNEELAQLTFAAFLGKPFLAKDKKSTLFNRDYTKDEVLINEYYEKIFYYPENNDKAAGILFEKSKREIDEVLFIKFLYKQSKGYLKKMYEDRIEKANEKIKNTPDGKDTTLEDRVMIYQRNKEINNICMFYCITLYYEIRKEFDEIDSKKEFTYEAFYSNKSSSYKKDIITNFADSFLSKTIEIISKSLDGTTNVGNWIRKAQSQENFLKILSNEIAIDSKIEESYNSFISKFKK